jgi:hypothetical protein
MSDRDDDARVVDPPENQPGGSKASLESTGEEEKEAIDPPSNDGGTE